MTLLKRIATPVAVVLGLALAGCIKSEQTFTIYPDGSGKVEINQTLMGMMASMMKGENPMGGDEDGAPGKKPDPFEMIRKGVGGKVYWTNLKTSDGPNGEFTISGTGYFENVNDIKPEKGTLTFTKADDGGSIFEMTQEMPDELKGGGFPGMAPARPGEKPTPEEEAQRKQMMEMMKGMLAGFEARITVVMPGAVKSAEGMKPADGRKAEFKMTEQDMVGMMDSQKLDSIPTRFKVVSAAPSGIDAEFEAFKKDLAAAKEASKAAPARQGDEKKGDEKKGDEKKGDEKKGDEGAGKEGKKGDF
jgi:hypothetical protein